MILRVLGIWASCGLSAFTFTTACRLSSRAHALLSEDQEATQ